MPIISEFYGISIMRYYDDHAPPHFHAKHGDDEALIQISPLEPLKGRLSTRALNLVLEWAQNHQDELMEDWNHASNNKKLHKIPPLE